MLCANPEWLANVVGVEGPFLQGRFTARELLHMEVPYGIAQYDDTVLLLNVPIYCTNQATYCFCAALADAIKKREYTRSKADLCLYYLTVYGQLALMVPWVNSLILLGPQQIVDLMKDDHDKAFMCKTERPLNECVGSKIDFSRDAWSSWYSQVHTASASAKAEGQVPN